MSKKQQIFLTKVKEHRGILIKISKMYMDRLEDIEDLQQEIIYQLWKSYDGFKGQSAFSSWMYRVALNTAITFIKKEKRRVDRTELSTEQEQIPQEQDEHQKDKLAYFYKAVKKLNKIEKALILLFIEGHSHKEIAKNLGISEVNARVKLNRTKNKLKDIIKKQGYEF